MKLHLIDGNNVLRRNFETSGAAWAIQSYIQACIGSSVNGTLVWVWDGANAKKPRQEIWPAYKATSDSSDEFYKFMDKFRELLTYSNTLQIRCEGREADDVIAEMVKTKSPDTEIYIESNDQDYRQLVGDKVTLEYMSPTLEDLKADDIRLYKTLVGDSSDEIKGLSGFGHAAYLKLSDAQKCLLEEFLQDSSSLTEQEAISEVGLTKAKAKKLIESQETLKKCWDIIGFFHVPTSEIMAGSIQGVKNTVAAKAIFDELKIPITL